MDTWRQDKLAIVSEAVRLIEKRTNKLVQKINGASVGLWQHKQQVAKWEDDVAKLQDMSDRLQDFRGKLYIYSNRAYEEALKEWGNGVEK